MFSRILTTAMVIFAVFSLTAALFLYGIVGQLDDTGREVLTNLLVDACFFVGVGLAIAAVYLALHHMRHIRSGG